MKKVLSILILSILITGCTAKIRQDQGLAPAPKVAPVKVDSTPVAPTEPSLDMAEKEEAEAPPPINMPPPPPPPPEVSPDETSLAEPIPKAPERISLKPFGLFITPETSPVKDENFTGYHTGTDFEIFEDELNKDVPVYAICSGAIQEKRFVGGYGGVVVQDCVIDKQKVTVLYGHLKLSSAGQNVGAQAKTGGQIALLGNDKSTETDGARKHLHLGIHRGGDVDYRGYVGNEEELKEWVDYES